MIIQAVYTRNTHAIMRLRCTKAVLLLFLMLFSASSLFAQREFLVRGVIKDRESSGRVAGAQIINQRTQGSVSSSELGLFQIRAAIGDTLLIMKSGYSDFTAAVNTDKVDIIVLLNRNRMLKQVDIVGQSKQSEMEDIKRDFKRNGSFYQGKPPVMSFFFKPLTAVYELFGKTPKNARRFGRYAETEIEQTHIDGFFNDNIVKSSTGLQDGQALDKFMFDYRPSFDRTKNWTQYDAIKYIKDSYRHYTESLKTDSTTAKKEVQPSIK